MSRKNGTCLEFSNKYPKIINFSNHSDIQGFSCNFDFMTYRNRFKKTRYTY